MKVNITLPTMMTLAAPQARWAPELGWGESPGVVAMKNSPSSLVFGPALSEEVLATNDKGVMTTGHGTRLHKYRIMDRLPVRQEGRGVPRLAKLPQRSPFPGLVLSL